MYFIRNGEFKILKWVKMPDPLNEDNSNTVREGLSRAKDPKQKNAERNFAKNVTDKLKQKCLMK